MITNADITIYNYWYNTETKEKEYRRTQIQGVHWYTDQKIAMRDKGVVSGDVYKIRIPDDAVAENGRKFLDTAQYRLLGKEEVDRYWTVDLEDLFVKGLVEDGIVSLSSLKQYGESGKIISFSVNAYGSNPHIRIGGVC